MNRTEVIERLARGESITPGELAEARAANELAELQREADALIAARRRDAEAAARRESLITDLLAADRDAEAAARDFAAIQTERAAATRAFDLREIAARNKWFEAYQRFYHTFRQVAGAQPEDWHKPGVGDLRDELQARGAAVRRVVENIAQLPASPSQLALAHEIEAGKLPPAA
jgi:hypothetical protein